MEYIEIFGKEYGFCRSSECSYKDKYNRMVKLACRFEELSNKFDRMIERGGVVSENARLALACKMMMYTGIRIGNEGSAEGYVAKPHPGTNEKEEFVQTYGLTTLLAEHLTVKQRKAYFHFLGKKHVANKFTVNGILARQVGDLFRMYDGNTLFGISCYTLTKFIKRYVGCRFTPKDFRTMRANMLAYEKFDEICGRELPQSKKEFNAEVKEIAEYVSNGLNNTPGVCKASYIDKKLWDEMADVRPVTKN